MRCYSLDLTPVAVGHSDPKEGSSVSEVAYVLLGAFVGGILTYFTTLRTLFNQSVVGERKDWRDEVRKITLDVVRAVENCGSRDLTALRHRLAMHLNPRDPEDNAILNCAILQGGETCDCAVDEFVSRISILLKHDWERAKLETSFAKKYFVRAHRPSHCEVKRDPKTAKFRKFTRFSWLFAPIIVVLIFFLIVPLIVEPHLWPLVDRWQSGWNFIWPPTGAE